MRGWSGNVKTRDPCDPKVISVGDNVQLLWAIGYCLTEYSFAVWWKIRDFLSINGYFVNHTACRFTKCATPQMSNYSIKSLIRKTTCSATIFRRSESVQPASSNPAHQRIRSASSLDFIVPRTRTKFGDRNFSVACTTVWNSLPESVRSAEILSSFYSAIGKCSKFLFNWLLALTNIIDIVLHNRYDFFVGCTLNWPLIVLHCIIPSATSQTYNRRRRLHSQLFPQLSGHVRDSLLLACYC